MGPFCSIRTPLGGSLLRYRNQRKATVFTAASKKSRNAVGIDPGEGVNLLMGILSCYLPLYVFSGGAFAMRAETRGIASRTWMEFSEK